MHAVHFASALALLLALLGSTPSLAQPQVDRSAPFAQGLLAWWVAVPGLTGGRFLYDLMGRTHATLVNMATAGTSGWAAPTRAGDAGEIRFDGTNDYVDIPSTGYLFPPAFTLTAWVKRTAIGVAYQNVFTHTSGDVRVFQMKSDGRIATALLTTGTTFSHDGGAIALAVGTWYFVAFSYSSTSGFEVSVNGVQDTFDAPNGTAFAITQAQRWGANMAGSADFFPGAMNDIRLYNKALSLSQLRAMMQDNTRSPLVTRSLPVGVVEALVQQKHRFFPFFGP